MSAEVLQVIWYCIFALVVGLYVMLDGFDLGVGALHLTHRTDYERRISLNAIGPVWDGNEVWLIIVIGGLFAGFPFAYATLMSTFYIPVMALIGALILRAVSIEIRGKLESVAWRNLWDVVFCGASAVIALGLGLVLGNLVQGISLNPHHEFMGGFGDFFHPYAILVAVLVLSLCCMHGAIYLVMKTEGEVHDNFRRWVNPTLIVFILLYIATSLATLIYQPHMVDRFRAHPWMFVFGILNVLAIANIPRCINKGKDGWAFLSSAASIALFVLLYALGTFPNIIRSTTSTEANSLTISNSYASPETLKILLIIVCIGVPLAIAYFIILYFVFRGKVKLDESSY